MKLLSYCNFVETETKKIMKYEQVFVMSNNRQHSQVLFIKFFVRKQSFAIDVLIFNKIITSRIVLTDSPNHTKSRDNCKNNQLLAVVQTKKMIHFKTQIIIMAVLLISIHECVFGEPRM